MIERLQSENDRLRRELKLVTLQREEEQRRADMARQGLENLRSINENLAGQATAERKAVERKERVLERLRGELDRERELRAREKLEAQVMREETDKTVVALQEDLRRESEMAKLWRTRHDTLSSSWKSLEEEHRRNFERMRTDLQSLQAARKSDLERVRRYETTVEQQAREVEKAKSSHENMKSLHERYKAEIERETRDMRMLARGNEAESERILEASKKALGEMRYLNNISQYVRGVGLDGEDGRDPLHPLPVAPPQRASNNIELGLSKNQKTESQREWELRD